MPIFGRRPAPAPVVRQRLPGLAEQAAAEGWQPVAGPPFHHHVVDGVHDITRAMYGAPRPMDGERMVGGTTFSDGLRASINGRTVIVSNANTYIDPALFQAGHFSPDVAVCAVELATIVPGAIVQPYRIPQIRPLGRTETGNRAFDDQFRVSTIAAGFIRQVLTPEVQRMQVLAMFSRVDGS
jgi:hypothetical protein